MAKLATFPNATKLVQGHLVIGGFDTVDLAAEFGTPLYLFDEATLRHKCREYIEEFNSSYPDTLVIYAAKAFINRQLAQIFKEDGLGLDVVSGGELSIANSVAFPMEKVYFHGNNKALGELELAIGLGVGRIVVDNFYELSLLSALAKELGVTQDILLRLSPGVDPHTNVHTTTGIIDSKFGFPIVTGQAERALQEAMSAPNLNPIGLHFHLGSPIYELEPYCIAIEIVLQFAAEMRNSYGFELSEFSPGGGFAIQYAEDSPAPAIADYAQAITQTLLALSKELSLPSPRLIVEPGRGIVGPAGVALYTVGSIKDIPGIRKYVSTDGGLADNIRPALYGAKYEAIVANKAGAADEEQVAICGKFCESGDILIKDIHLPVVVPGDIIAVPASGAYCLSMASNYNASLKPAIVLVREGKARLIRRRQNYDDLIRYDFI